MGLIPMFLIAAYLGKKVDDMARVVEEDGLPAINVPTPTRSSPKVSLIAFHRWLKGRSVNAPLTVDQLEEELERLDKRLKKKPSKA